MDTDVGDTDVDSDTHVDPPEEVEITAVTPRWANARGGSTLHVEGKGFGDAPTVTIGGVATDWLPAGGGALDVVVPPTAPGYVDLVVDAGLRDDAALIELFADQAGRWQMFGRMTKYEIPAIAYVATSVRIWMTDPRPQPAWTYFSPTLDTCTSHPPTYQVTDETIGPAVALDTELLRLSGPSPTPLTLLRDDDLAYTTNLEAASWYAGKAYDLDPLATIGALDGLSVPAFVRLPGVLVVAEPDLATTDFAVAPDQHFSWDTEHSADVVLILIDNTLERLYCAVVDDGSFDLPAEAWANYTATKRVTVAVARIAMSGATLPHDGASVAVEGQHWVEGTTSRP